MDWKGAIILFISLLNAITPKKINFAQTAIKVEEGEEETRIGVLLPIQREKTKPIDLPIMADG